jgi:non-heme chloroperoxidase
MTRIRVGWDSTRSLELHCDDEGSGRPVVLIHGWPQASECWSQKRQALVGAGYRVISYDRRGSGRSSRTSLGHDYDTYAEDLNRLLTVLDLRGAALVGFSMGAGEVVRYLGTYGEDRVSKAVLIAALPPFLLETPDSPAGLSREAIDQALRSMDSEASGSPDDPLGQGLNCARPGSVPDDGRKPPSRGRVAALWQTDFRDDLPRINVPTLVIHGDADAVLPLAVTGKRLAQGIEAARLLVIAGASHDLLSTHGAEVNAALLEFLSQP